MRRRREEQLRLDIEDVVKDKGKGLFGWLIKGLLNKLIEAILKMLEDKGWVDLSEDNS